ncbi:hypothetical protein CG709_15405 [Lachnotalea glycerini]|nr:hypothetical protein CG709_15405 [Lachnotalea glycerini]
MNRFEAANQEVTDIVIRVGKLSAILNPATFAVLNIAIIAIIWFGSKRVDMGILAQGQIIAFVNYITQISLALVVVANLVVIFTKASASAARINEIFNTRPSFDEGNGISFDSFSQNEPKISLKDGPAPKDGPKAAPQTQPPPPTKREGDGSVVGETSKI